MAAGMGTGRGYCRLRSGKQRWSGWRIQQFHRFDAVRLADDEANRMKPLQPGHHSASIVANEIGVDSVGVEDRLRDVGLDLIGKGSDDRVELGRPRLHLDPQASLQTESVTRQPRLPVESTLLSGTLSARFSC